ncbi:MAG: hypothetical protein V3G42_08515 [Oscillospiraceae bacterium]
MALSYRDIAQLRQKQREVSRKLQKTRTELEKVRDEVTAENQRKLEELQLQSVQWVQEREQKMLASYETILNQATSQQEQILEQEFQKYQREYEELNSEISVVLAEEQQKNEEILLRQQKFEEAYFQRQEFVRQRAEESKKMAEIAIRQATETIPIEWFLSGHMDLYRTRLQEIAHWMKNGFYESTIGIAENLVLMLHLDELEAEKRFQQWFHYYTVLHGALQAQKKLLFDTAVKVPEHFTEFRQNENIVDGRMNVSFMDYWSDNGYSKLLSQYAKTCEALAQFHMNGEPLLDKPKMLDYMIKHPEKSALYQELALYSNAMKTAQQLHEAEKQVHQIHDRMSAFHERLQLMKSVRNVLKMRGYQIKSVSFFHEQPSETLLICFCNSMNHLQFELMLIPILRRIDEHWVNQAVCFTDSESSSERLGELRHILAETLIKAEIQPEYQTIHANQKTEERVNIAIADMKMKINGRLN